MDVVSGEEATLDIVVKNNAEVRASFDIHILDPCPCGLSGNYHRFTFNASKTVTWKPSDTTYGGWVCKDTSTPIKWNDGVVIVFGVIVMMILYRRLKQRKVT